MSIPSTLRGFFLSLGLLAMASCGQSKGSTGTGGAGGASDCTPGARGCVCLSDNTCNPGFACADDLNKCVQIASGSGGSPGSGGTTASGASTGSGGVTTGSGGSTGSGGTNGSGGSTASGGNTGSGGTSATGGTMGIGGFAGPNLVMNGDLSQGDSGWNIGQGNPSTKGVMNGAYCATFSNQTVLIGWGSASIAATLMSGASYTLVYQASSTDPNTSLEIHIGQAVSPYNADTGSITAEKPTSSLTTFAKTFSSTANDSTAGIAFLFSSSANNVTVCVDNVALYKN